MTDIYIMWGVLLYLIVGVAASYLILKRLCNDKKANKRHLTIEKYADEHAFEVFLIVFIWPVYLLVGLLGLLLRKVIH